MHIANLVSLALFIGFVLQYAFIETPRTQVVDLEPQNVKYCELTECPRIQGLELSNALTAQSEIKQQPFGLLLELDFTNHLMLQGERELWLRVENAEGKLLEMARVEIELDLKNRTTAKFLLTSSESDISGGKLLLGY
jgi:hypothetical protein